MKLILAGIAFAILWASASIATKIALQSAQPFMIAVSRFFIAAIIMLFVAHALLKERFPEKQEWKQLAIYGTLNITIYLGIYVIAMMNVSAGLGSLAVATNPVFISIITGIWLKQKVKLTTIFSLVLCAVGILVAATSLLKSSYATPQGLTLLLLSMLAYSLGAVYFSKSQWNGLHILVINGWQTLIGGVLMLPLLFAYYDSDKNVYDVRSIGGILWLAIPVSIAAVLLWLYLLMNNTVKASFWLFLCPVFGFGIASIMLNEPIGANTFIGVILVLAGLYLVQKEK